MSNYEIAELQDGYMLVEAVEGLPETAEAVVQVVDTNNTGRVSVGDFLLVSWLPFPAEGRRDVRLATFKARMKPAGMKSGRALRESDGSLAGLSPSGVCSKCGDRLPMDYFTFGDDGERSDECRPCTIPRKRKTAAVPPLEPF